jgi:hypothetical protein
MGVADPMFLCDLALQLGMPVSELGQRMSNYELNVTWPAYFDAKRHREESMSRDSFDAELERGS